jgi:hypothetical protein
LALVAATSSVSTGNVGSALPVSLSRPAGAVGASAALNVLRL